VIDPVTLKEWLAYDPATGVFTWRKNPGKKRQAGKAAGCLCKKQGYVLICVQRELRMAHRLAWLYMTGEWPPDTIDHRDGNRANNRWDNIRPATFSENAANRGPRIDCASGVPGVSYRASRGTWRAYITFEGKTVWLGSFKTKDEASAARSEAERRVFGAFQFASAA